MGLELMILLAPVGSGLLILAHRRLRQSGGLQSWLGDWVDRVNESTPAHDAPDYQDVVDSAVDD